MGSYVTCSDCGRLVQRGALKDDRCPRCCNRLQGANAALMDALEQLKQHPMTCSELGSNLWGTGFRKPQDYARPAGRLLRRMQRMGLTETFYSKSERRSLWRLKMGWEAVKIQHSGQRPSCQGHRR